MEKLFYFAKVFDGLYTLGVALLVTSIVALVVCFPLKYTCYDSDDEQWDIISRWIKRCWWILAIGCIFTIFIPDKKTFLFMVGGKAVDELVEHTDIEEIPGNTINLLNEYIKAETENVKAKHDTNNSN